MITILKEKFCCFDNDRSVVTAELAADAKNDLPAANAIAGRTLSQGSIAWVISTGAVYGFRSDGKWVDQDTGEVYDPSAED
ncbi:hypothetical protein [Ruminococcus flavefaciens]|uniref:hypothetical protein n=1 Tax=Ruminococcus flavefaciens TaxID=1265 RepID=UPI0003044595|nr:hypothetical protein [Ruminococcus flavefaciens]